tara:strand:+ start:758 stop:1012 length:255 start_codon:yes stop_codon:yes gene_type:complete
MNKIDSIKKKIVYRSEYRGIKEMDLILSAFIKKYLNSLNYNELLDLNEILENDDDLIFKWYSGRITSGIKETRVSNLLKNFKLD